jgi:hypothetical protein
MQIFSLRITPIIATVCFTFAIPAAFADHTIGTPQGTLTLTTPPDSTLVYWPGESKPHHQMRADETYTAASSARYVNGAFDPHASLGIFRYFQNRTPGTYSLGLMSEIMQGKNKPANSGFNQAQCNQTYGPYTPTLSNYVKQTNGSLVNVNEGYGVETIELVVYDANNNPTVLDYQKIDIYQAKASNAANFYVQNFLNKVALNTDTTKSYLGDPPRVTLTASPIYPGAKAWVVIYPGNAQATPPANATTIDNTTFNAPVGDAASYPSLYIDLGKKYINASGIYTLQVMQEFDNNFGTEAYGSPASFSIKNSYNVTSQLGLVK